jgi:hypothetical protein
MRSGIRLRDLATLDHRSDKPGAYLTNSSAKEMTQGLKPRVLGGLCGTTKKVVPFPDLQGRGQDALATAGGTPALRSFFRSLFSRAATTVTILALQRLG